MVELCGELLGDKKEIFEASADLLKRTSETDELKWIGSKKALATFLNKFDLVAGHDSTKQKRGYRITREWVNDVKSRYIPSKTDSEVSEPSENRAQHGPEGNL